MVWFANLPPPSCPSRSTFQNLSDWPWSCYSDPLATKPWLPCGKPLWLDAAIMRKLVSSSWLWSGAWEVWRLWLLKGGRPSTLNQWCIFRPIFSTPWYLSRNNPNSTSDLRLKMNRAEWLRGGRCSAPRVLFSHLNIVTHVSQWLVWLLVVMANDWFRWWQTAMWLTVFRRCAKTTLATTWNTGLSARREPWEWLRPSPSFVPADPKPSA